MSYRDSGKLSVVSRIGDMNEAASEELYCQFGKRFLELCTITSLVVYGTPDAEIRKRLDPFGAVYMTPFDGFSR